MGSFFYHIIEDMDQGATNHPSEDALEVEEANTYFGDFDLGGAHVATRDKSKSSKTEDIF